MTLYSPAAARSHTALSFVSLLRQHARTDVPARCIAWSAISESSGETTSVVERAPRAAASASDGNW